MNRRLFSQGFGVGASLWALSPTNAFSAQSANADFYATSKAKRQSTDRPYDAKAGLLGNLRFMNIVTPNARVLFVSGPDNRILKTSGRFGLKPPRHTYPDGKGDAVKPTDIDLHLEAGRTKEPMALIQVATLDDVYVAGMSTGSLVWFRDVKLAHLRVSLHAQTALFTDCNLGALHLSMNGQGTVVAQGSAEQLQVSSSQANNDFYLHDLAVRQRSIITPTNTEQRYTLDIRQTQDPVYSNPTSTNRKVEERYPVQVRGDPSKLKMGGPGRAKVTTLSDESVAKARGIREQFEREFAALG
jgi:hypothetical protein